MNMGAKTLVFLTSIIVLTALGIYAVPYADPTLFEPTALGQEKGKALEDAQVALGRQIYIREGCWYCHSQFVRPQDQGRSNLFGESMGATSEPGDYVYDSPNLLGSERTGPDLTHVGSKYQLEWHVCHIKDPRSDCTLNGVVYEARPNSIMPSYSYLSEEELYALAAYLMSLK